MAVISRPPGQYTIIERPLPHKAGSGRRLPIDNHHNSLTAAPVAMTSGGLCFEILMGRDAKMMRSMRCFICAQKFC
jgi:hypothetical protein